MILEELPNKKGVAVVLDGSTSVGVVKEEMSRVEFYKQQLDIALSSLNVSDTKKYLLAYIEIFGQDYKNKVLESRILTTMDSINNYESALRREKLIVNLWPDCRLNPEISLVKTNHVLITHYTIVDTDHVNHRNFKK